MGTIAETEPRWNKLPFTKPISKKFLDRTRQIADADPILVSPQRMSNAIRELNH